MSYPPYPSLAERAFADRDVAIYVSPQIPAGNGDDLLPGTAAEPVATLEGAVRLLPAAWQRRARINFAKGTYVTRSESFLYAGKPVGPGNSAVIIEDPDDRHPPSVAKPLALVGGYDQRPFPQLRLIKEEPRGTYFFNQQLNINDDELVGSFLRVEAPDKSLMRLIRGNTSGSVTLNVQLKGLDFSKQPTVSIVNPSVTIRYDGTLMLPHNGDVLLMKGIRFQAATPKSRLVIFQQNVIAEGCEFDLGIANPAPDSAQLDVREFAALRATSQAGLDDELFDGDLRGPLGCYVHDGTFWAVARSRITQFFVMKNVAFVARRSDAIFTSIGAVASTLSAFDDSVLDHTAADDHFGLMDGQQKVNGLVTFENNSTSRQLTQLRLIGSTHNAIQAYGRCFINVGSVTSDGGINGGHGINVFKMSQALIDYAGAKTEVSGRRADTLIGNKKASYAQIRPKGVSDGLNRIEV